MALFFYPNQTLVVAAFPRCGGIVWSDRLQRLGDTLATPIGS